MILNAWNWILANHVVLYTTIVLILNSLINGLTAYPDTESVLGKIQHVIGLFSFLVHADSPGTLKVPFTHSLEPLPTPGVLQEKSAAPKGFAAGNLLPWLVLMSGAIAILGSCAWFSHVKADVVECSREEIVSVEKNVAADITSILLAGVAGWQAELASIASKVGEEVVGCVVAKLASGWAPPPGSNAALPPAAIRAHEYLAHQPQTFQL